MLCVMKDRYDFKTVSYNFKTIFWGIDFSASEILLFFFSPDKFGWLEVDYLVATGS